MAQEKPGFKLTEDAELRRDPEYQKVMAIVRKMWEAGVIERARGYCFSVSDMVKTLLLHEGITARIVECHLAVIRTEPPSFQFLGYDQNSRARDIDTHVVCVTDTKIPMIIDLSVGYLAADVAPFIVERASAVDDLLAEFKIKDSTWKYTIKAEQKFPEFHQQNIVQRMFMDRQVQGQLNRIKLFLVVAITVSMLNAVRGAYDFYQVYINRGNDWGPDTIRELKDEVKRIDEKLGPDQLRKRIEDAGFTVKKP